MSYTKDRDKGLRGVGSIAARDMVSNRGRRFAAAKAQRMAHTDRIMANVAIAGFQGFGALNLDADRPHPDLPGQGSHPMPGSGGAGASFSAPRKYTVRPGVGFSSPGPLKAGNAGFSTSTGTRFIVDPLPTSNPVLPPASTAPTSTVQTVSGGGGGGGTFNYGGGGTTTAITDPIPEDMPEVVDPGVATPTEMFGLTTKNMLILAALGVGGWWLWKRNK